MNTANSLVLTIAGRAWRVGLNGGENVIDVYPDAGEIRCPTQTTLAELMEATAAADDAPDWPVRRRDVA